MKKSILILTLILAFSFVFSVSCFGADDAAVTLSDDYSVLYLDGDPYSRANTDAVNLDVYAGGSVFISNIASEEPYFSYNEYEVNLNIELSDSQKEELTKIYVRSNGEEQLFVTAELYFKDGSTIWYSYVRDDVKEDFKKVTEGKPDEFVVEYRTYSDQGDILKTVSRDSLLTGDKEKIDFYEYNDFDVAAFSDSFNYSVYKGLVYIGENEYYYFDFEENGITNSYDLYELNVLEIEAHRITDEEAIAIIEEGLQEYYDDDYGYLFNDELTDIVSKIFFSLVFAAVPVVTAVITFILAIKSKKALYKKLLLATSGLSLSSLATFIYLAFTLFNK